VTVRPADAPHRRRQRAQAADPEEELDPAVAEGEATVRLEPEPRLEASAAYVGPSRLTPFPPVGTVGWQHGRIIGHKRHSQEEPRMPTRRRVLGVLGTLVLGIVGALPAASAQEITLSVAISMKDAVEELGRTFAGRHPGVRPRYNFGSSGELQKQIEAGAPVDLFVSAAQRQMDELDQKGLIVKDSRRVFARNVLTVIKPIDSRLDLSKPQDLLDARVGRIVIGSPKTVPVGQYAEESLRALGLWDRLQPKLVLAENVRQALEYVARGEVDAGFVYTTDAAVRADRVKEAFRPGEETYRPVLYPVAVVTSSKQPALGRAFIELLLSPEGRAVLARLGFQPPPPGAR
jgi:molybdate transport system substrate-binding protein